MGRPLLRGLTALACILLAGLVVAYGVVFLMSHDEEAAPVGDRVAATVVNLVLVFGLGASALYVRRGKHLWLPTALVVYMMIAGGLGLLLWAGTGWTFHITAPVAALQASILIGAGSVLVLVLLLRAGLAKKPA
jgi:hypothetical protein